MKFGGYPPIGKSGKKNQVNREVYEVLYKCFIGKDNNECFYCGDRAETWDHQPPISRVDDYRALNFEREIFIKVPCCKECNSLAGDTLTSSLIERDTLIKTKIFERYHKILSTPRWDEEELDELGPVLRQSVEEIQLRRIDIDRRLDYRDGVYTYLEEP